jgi:hypothetical protein
VKAPHCHPTFNGYSNAPFTPSAITKASGASTRIPVRCASAKITGIATSSTRGPSVPMKFTSRSRVVASA